MKNEKPGMDPTCFCVPPCFAVPHCLFIYLVVCCESPRNPNAVSVAIPVDSAGHSVRRIMRGGQGVMGIDCRVAPPQPRASQLLEFFL